MPIYNGQSDLVKWSFFTGAATDREWRNYLDFLTDVLRVEERDFLILTVVMDYSPPNAAQRKMMAEARAEWGTDLSKIIHHGFITDSAVIRAVLTAMAWMRKPDYPETVTSSLAQVVDAFEGAGVTIDPVGLVQEVGALLPESDFIRFRGVLHDYLPAQQQAL